MTFMATFEIYAFVCIYFGRPPVPPTQAHPAKACKELLSNQECFSFLNGQIGRSDQNGPISDLIQIFPVGTFYNAERLNCFPFNNLNGLIVLTVEMKLALSFIISSSFQRSPFHRGSFYKRGFMKNLASRSYNKHGVKLVIVCHSNNVTHE